MNGLEVSVALPEQRSVIRNLMQLYVHDFSEHWAGSQRGELEDDGRFPDYPLDAYWNNPARIPLLMRVNGHLAGFALLNDHSHSGISADRNMAEFFIVRKHRRGGIGTAAAHIIFSRYPGQWEAAVARRNLGALGFWRNAIRRHPLVADIVESDVATDAWNGPILRFRILPAP